MTTQAAFRNSSDESRANGTLYMVFESGRCASILLDYTRGREVLQQIARGETIVGDTDAITETGDKVTVYSHCIKGSAVTHAVLVKMTPGSPIEPEDLVPNGFHDGANRGFAPPLGGVGEASQAEAD